MTSKDKQDVIAICNILADKMSDSGKVAVQQIIGAVEDMVENEPCEDAISRESVIRLVEQYPNIIGNRCSGLIADIKHLPSVTPSYNSVKTELEQQTRWIPVSERLPEERNYYLITVEIDGMNGCKPYYEIQTSWYSDKQFVVEYKGDGLIARRRVMAWMPLPQPYKAESEDKE